MIVLLRGTYFVFSNLQSDRSKEYSAFGKVSYDEANMRVRIAEEVEEGSERTFYDTLYLHNIVSTSFTTPSLPQSLHITPLVLNKFYHTVFTFVLIQCLVCINPVVVQSANQC